jgi:iron complex outermembrane receptor protein
VARWGGHLGDDAHIRLSALAVDRGNTRWPVVRRSATRAPGCRAASAPTGHRGRSLTLQGDIYHGGSQPANNLAPAIHGGNLVARYGDSFADGSPWKLQASYDLVDRDDVDLFRTRARPPTCSSRTSRRWAPASCCGAAATGSRATATGPRPSCCSIPRERTLSWANVFAQYQRLLGPKLQVTAGMKFERNSYTGIEAAQPAAGVAAFAAAHHLGRGFARGAGAVAHRPRLLLPGRGPVPHCRRPRLPVRDRQRVRARAPRPGRQHLQLFGDAVPAAVPRLARRRAGRPPATVQNLVQGPSTASRRGDRRR